MKAIALQKPFSLFRDAIRKPPKPALIVGVVIVVLAAAAFCIKLLPRQPEARYELPASDGEIDFDAPDISVHTAADGVAVISPPISGEDMIPVPAAVPEPAVTAPLTEVEAVATHSGFTLPVAMDGDSIGALTIPDIDLSVRVYETDDDMADMERGAAHFKSTSAWIGNVAISAHNITLDGSPGYFLNLHKLSPGAVVQYETALGSRAYAVESVTEIEETDWSPLDRTEDNRITLITCISGHALTYTM